MKRKKTHKKRFLFFPFLSQIGTTNKDRKKSVSHPRFYKTKEGKTKDREGAPVNRINNNKKKN